MKKINIYPGPYHWYLGRFYGRKYEEAAKLAKKFLRKSFVVLDVGCGDGTLTRHFVKGNSVTGMDIDPHMLNSCRKKLGINTKLVDLNGPWKITEKFDVVVAAEVIEHLYYPDVVCKKVASVLKPGGIFIGSVPNAYNIKNRMRYLFGIQKNTPLEDRTHINQFSYNWLKSIFEKEFKKVYVTGMAAGLASGIAEKFPNLGSFMLVWRCEK